MYAARDGETWEGTGNAYTLTLQPNGAAIHNEYTDEHQSYALDDVEFGLRWWLDEVSTEKHGPDSIKPIRLPRQHVVDGLFVMELDIEFRDPPSDVWLGRACRSLSKHDEVNATWTTTSPTDGKLRLASTRDFKDADLWVWMLRAPRVFEHLTGSIRRIHGVPRHWWY